jgi:hypothetical protein
MPHADAVERINTRRLAQAASFDPALAYPMPDVEALVWSAISHLGDDYGAAIESWCYVSVPMPGPSGWVVSSSIQVDVRDQSKRAAFRRADTARRIVLGLVSVPWDEGVVNRSDCIGGPAWLPDYDTGRPRYVLQFLVQVHPNNGKVIT